MSNRVNVKTYENPSDEPLEDVMYRVEASLSYIQSYSDNPDPLEIWDEFWSKEYFPLLASAVYTDLFKLYEADYCPRELDTLVGKALQSLETLADVLNKAAVLEQPED